MNRQSHGRVLALLSFVLILHLSLCSNAFLFTSSMGKNQDYNCRPHQQQPTALLSCALEEIDSIHTRKRIKRRQHYNLTILIPAYDEIDRIGETLCSYINYMKRQPVYQHDAGETSFQKQTTGECSILVIDDGSTDGTCQYIQEKTWMLPKSNDTADDFKKETNLWKVNEDVSCISLSENQGKGAAIERGMMELQCGNDIHEDDDGSLSIVLVADADGSADISCLGTMMHSLECLLESSSTSSSNDNLAIVVGKRQYPQSKKSLLRSILSWGFRTCVSILMQNTLGVTDTQCGFKLMTSQTGKVLYQDLGLKRWSHDVEVLYRASCLENVSVGECGVDWVDKDGSKLVSSGRDAVVMSAVMLDEIGKMRMMYALGRWGINSKG